MRKTEWCFAALGLALALMTNLSVLWDIYALHQKPQRATVSGWVYRTAEANGWLRALLAAGLFGTAAALYAHLGHGWGGED